MTTTAESGVGSSSPAPARSAGRPSGLPGTPAWDRESPGGPRDGMDAGVAGPAYGMRTDRVSPYLLVEAVADRYGCTVGTVQERCRLRQLPHRKLPGSRRLLFLEAELERYDAGGELVVKELARGGRVVEVRS